VIEDGFRDVDRNAQRCHRGREVAPGSRAG
jgi:hypothetical protein